MVLLMLFALIAGAATALSPCVLPVLPDRPLGRGDRRPPRPLGIVTGLAVSFTFATVALVYVIDALGLPDDLLRNIAIVVLFAFGFALLVPSLSRPARGVAQPRRRRRRAAARGDGFGSGFARSAPASASSTRPAPGRSSPA